MVYISLNCVSFQIEIMSEYCQEDRSPIEYSLENTLRHQTNVKPKYERAKRFPHRKPSKDSKKRYSIDDMRLNASAIR